MNSPTEPTQGEIEEILTKAFNDFYDYITERDIIKAAHEYSEKTAYKEATQAILSLLKRQDRYARAACLEPSEELCYSCGNKTFWFDDAYRCIYDGTYTTVKSKNGE